jgi:hypothetical protein
LLQELKDAHILNEETVSRIRMFVLWMHAKAHDTACQLKYSGLFAEGARRSVGEVVEQLWSQLLQLTRKTRFMSAAHYQHTINLVLESLTFWMLVAFPALLEKKLKNNTKIHGERERLGDQMP